MHQSAGASTAYSHKLVVSNLTTQILEQLKAVSKDQHPRRIGLLSQRCLIDVSCDFEADALRQGAERPVAGRVPFLNLKRQVSVEGVHLAARAIFASMASRTRV